MSYLPIISFWVLSTIFVTFMNLYFIKNNITETWDIIKISFFLIPVQYITATLFSFYYVKGINHFSFPTLVVASYGLTISMSFVVNYFILKKTNYDLLEMIGVRFIIIGIICIFYVKFK